MDIESRPVPVVVRAANTARIAALDRTQPCGEFGLARPEASGLERLERVRQLGDVLTPRSLLGSSRAGERLPIAVVHRLGLHPFQFSVTGGVQHFLNRFPLVNLYERIAF